MEKGLESDQKMIILWDVYCRHRDPDLLELIQEEYPHIVLLHIPANLTEICQPLDIYFNSQFKVKLASLRNKRVAEQYDEWRKSNKEDSFKVSTALSATKHHFPLPKKPKLLLTHWRAERVTKWLGN